MSVLEKHKLDDLDRELIDAAGEVLSRNFDVERHSVGAAVLTGSGKIYSAVNVESVGYGPCAEPIAIGSAISAGEREIQRIVAVSGRTSPYSVISPCGNCRQLMYEYAPDCLVIVEIEGELVKVRVRDLFPAPYSAF